MVNSELNGRFGNLLFINFIMHIVSKKFNYKAEYHSISECQQLGFKYHDGELTNYNMRQYSDNSIVELISGSDNIDHGVSFCGYGQINDIVIKYRRELNSIINKDFETRDGVFVHVRLDDAIEFNPGIHYYTTVLKKINAVSGFISSDTPNHPLVLQLINEFNLTLHDASTIETLNFAKKFTTLVLSGGTYSWWIGALSNASKIYYPKQTKIWHGDIFVFPEWIGVDLN